MLRYGWIGIDVSDKLVTEILKVMIPPKLLTKLNGVTYEAIVILGFV